MTSVAYKFIDRTFQVVEVEDSLYEKIREIETEMASADRRHRRHRILQDDFDPYGVLLGSIPNLSQDMENQEVIKFLHQELDALPPQQREVLRRIYFYRQKASDIATELNISCAAVSKGKQKALKTLRKKFERFVESCPIPFIDEKASPHYIRPISRNYSTADE